MGIQTLGGLRIYTRLQREVVADWSLHSSLPISRLVFSSPVKASEVNLEAFVNCNKSYAVKFLDGLSYKFLNWDGNKPHILINQQLTLR